VHRHGHAAFETVLEARRPLTEALFDLMRDTSGDATAEQRAQLRHRLEDAARRIPDRALAGEYRRVWLDRFFAARSTRPSGLQPRSLPRPLPSAGTSTAERVRILLAVLIRHPSLLRDVGHALSELELPAAYHRLRDALLFWADHADVLDSGGLIDHLTTSGLAAVADQALATVPVPLPDFVSAEAMPGEAEAGWWHIFGLMHRGRLEEEVAAARRDFADRADDAAQRRLVALCTARDALARDEGGNPAQ
jgi:DNA primase